MRLGRPGRAGSRHASPAAPTRPASGYPADPARLDHAPVRPAAVAGLMLGLAGLVLLQVTLVAFLPTPVTAPDLVVVAVLALAIARGPVVGGLAGAWSGLLLDLVPPAAGVLGGWMLVLGLAGYVLGRVAATFRPGPLAALAFLAVGAGLVVLARSAILWFAGTPIGWDALAVAAASSVLALVLAPLALLIVAPRTPQRTAPARTVPVELAR